MKLKLEPENTGKSPLQLVVTFPEIEYNKEEGSTTINWNWQWGYRRLEVTKTGMAFIYKWVLTLGWIQIRAWQTKSFDELSAEIIKTKEVK